MSLGTKHFYDFENFRVDPDERVLLCDGKPVPLTPKAFQMLVILVENHGHIVDKEKLLREIWADSFVEEGNLSVNARRLRKALADDANKPQYIETIARRGYRFVAEVKEVEVAEANGTIPPENAIRFPSFATSPLKSTHSRSNIQSNALRLVSTGPAQKLEFFNEGVDKVEPPSEELQPLTASGAAARRQSRKSAIVAYLVVAAFVVGAITLGFYFFPREDPAVAGKRSIAVLPLKPINAANRDVHVEMGIADALIIKLGSMKGFVIRPLSATRKYADIAQDPLAAGNDQHVDYVIDSNYQLADGKIRITAQLFNVATGEIEDTYKSEKEAGNIFAMQDAIASEVGNRLLARFGTTSSNTTAKRGTNNDEAYRLYLRSRLLAESRALSDAERAIELLDDAIRLDPHYAHAWALKAYAHQVKTISGRDINTHAEYQESMHAAKKALSLDGRVPDAHGAMCELKMSYEFDLAGAERACKSAVELDPNSSLAHQTYARSLMALGRFDEAIAEAKLAIDVDPSSLLNHRIYGCTLYMARRYDEAILQFKRTVELAPNSGAPAYYWLVTALEMKGDQEEIFDWFVTEQRLRKTDDEIVQAFRTAYQSSGWNGVVSEQAKRFELSDHGYYQAAYLNAKLGRKDKAFEYLEMAFQRREWPFAYIKVEPRLDPLRDDPRFDDLVKRVERK